MFVDQNAVDLNELEAIATPNMLLGVNETHEGDSIPADLLERYEKQDSDWIFHTSSRSNGRWPNSSRCWEKEDWFVVERRGTCHLVFETKSLKSRLPLGTKEVCLDSDRFATRGASLPYRYVVLLIIAFSRCGARATYNLQNKHMYYLYIVVPLMAGTKLHHLPSFTRLLTVPLQGSRVKPLFLLHSNS